jgi:hypothetical protein
VSSGVVAGPGHGLDVFARGKLALNNVASSNAAITRICPELISYFGNGVHFRRVSS